MMSSSRLADWEAEIIEGEARARGRGCDGAGGFRLPGAMCAGMREDTDMESGRRLTVQELVQVVQDIARSDEEVVAVLTHMMKTGQILLPHPPVHA